MGESSSIIDGYRDITGLRMASPRVGVFVLLSLLVITINLLEAAPGFNTAGACNCSRQKDGTCAVTQNWCISRSCTCEGGGGGLNQFKVCHGKCSGGTGGTNFMGWLGKR